MQKNEMGDQDELEKAANKMDRVCIWLHFQQDVIKRIASGIRK